MSQRLARLATKAAVVVASWTVIAFFVWPSSFLSTGGLQLHRNTTLSTESFSPLSTHSFFNHGPSKCLPPVTPRLLNQSREWSASCRKFAPFRQQSTRIATFTMSTGKVEELYNHVLENFMTRSMVQGEELHVLCDPMEEGIWNKIIFLLQVMLEQLLLPKEERIEWFFWIDRDVYLIDHCRPLETFLPPDRAPYSGDINKWFLGQEDESEKNRDSSGGSNIHMLAQYDLWGLNAGVFLLRVHPWSVALLQDVLAWRYFKPDVNLDFAEQSVLQILLDQPAFAPHVTYVPSHWFNAYTGGEPNDFLNRQDENLRTFQARRGDFLLHFAGHPRKNESMTRWIESLDKVGNVWEKGSVQRVLEGEIDQFWKECGAKGGLGSGGENCGTRYPEGRTNSSFQES